MVLIHRRAGAVTAAVAAVLAAATSPSLAAGSASAAVGAAQGASAFGTIVSIVCTSAGNCTAIGSMRPPSPKILFAVSEKHGVWGTAEAIPGLAALLGPKSGGATVTELSCPSEGNCGAGGSYSPAGHVTRAFVVSEKNGHWSRAEQVPGLAKLATGRFSEVETVSCPSPGNCGAGGSYTTSATKKGGVRQETFVVSERHGIWGKAEEAPGTAKLNVGGAAEFNQVTCPSAGNCLGVGSYEGKKGSGPFAVTEKHGSWGKARTFPRIMARTAVQARNFAGFAAITRISCRSIGNCTGAGFYYYDEDQDAVFAFSQKNGIWGAITPISFTGEFPGGVGQINLRLLSCPSQGNCVAGGGFGDPNDPELGQAYFVTERNGVWGNAEIPPGVLALSGSSMQSSLNAVACRSAGNCSAAGGYVSSGGSGVYVITEVNGVWGTAAQLAAVKPLNSSQLGVAALSCGAAGNCSLGGSFSERPSSQHVRPYVADQRNGIWGKAEPVKGIAP